MTPQKSNFLSTFFIAGLSLSLGLLFLNKWMFTAVPKEYFARVWQYYISYQDVGFARRILTGSVLEWTGINQIFENEFVFAYFFHSLSILIFAGIILSFLYKNKVQLQPENAWIIFFSPAFILHMCSTTGSTDVLLMSIVCLQVFYVKNLRIVFLTGCIGLLVHELYILLVPFVLWQILQKQAYEKLSFSRWMILGMSLFLVFIFITHYGVITLDQVHYDKMMAEKIPHAAHLHVLWSGYFELTTDLQQNWTAGIDGILKNSPQLYFGIITLSYMLLLNSIVSFQNRSLTFPEQMITFICLNIPILATFFAIDFHRWVCMASTLGIICLICAYKNKSIALKNWQKYTLIFYTFLAPFGGNEFHIPLPLHQVLLEKIKLILF